MRVYLTSNFAHNAQMRCMWAKLFPGEFFSNLVDCAFSADIVLVVNFPHSHDFPAGYPRDLLPKTIVAHMEPHMDGQYSYKWPEMWRAPDRTAIRDAWTHDVCMNLCEWLVSYTHDQIVSSEPFNDNEYRHGSLCAVMSSKHTDPGHVLRVSLVNKIGHDIDVYGHGDGKVFTHANWKGEVRTKEDALCLYRYTLNFENHAIKNYVTEKFWDAMICGTHLFYWGCPNILELIPSEFHACFTVLDLDEQCPDYDRALALVYEAMNRRKYEASLHLYPEFRKWIARNAGLHARLCAYST